jgi:hypothetical protein
MGALKHITKWMDMAQFEHHYRTVSSLIFLKKSVKAIQGSIDAKHQTITSLKEY